MDYLKYLNIFIDEANENVHALNRYLLDLEQKPGNIAMLNSVYRSVHTLKASSQSMGFKKMAELTHEMETLISAAGEGRVKQDGALFDVLFRCVDSFESILFRICEFGSEGHCANEGLLSEIEGILGKTRENASGAGAGASPSGSGKSAGNGYPGGDYSGFGYGGDYSGFGYGGDYPANGYHGGSGRHANSAASQWSNYSPIERTALQRAIGEGRHAYEIRVVLVSDCLMKAARAFIVISTIEKHGEIFRTEPKIEFLEDEKFDSEFVITLLSNESAESLAGSVSPLSEIKRVDIAELVPDKSAAAGDKPPRAAAGGELQPGKNVRVSIQALDNLQGHVAELSRLAARIGDILGKPTAAGPDGAMGKPPAAGPDGAMEKPLAGRLEAPVRLLKAAVEDIADSIVKLRTAPIMDAFIRFPELCAELAREFGKEAELAIETDDLRCDLSVLAEIRPIMIHILRNSIDHGMEAPEDRLDSGKPLCGKVIIRAYSDGISLYIEVEDDGSGVNIGKIRETAIRNEVFSQAEAMAASEDDILQLVFLPAFSSREQVSMYSGRGIGLDAVKSKIEELGGSVMIDSKEGRGVKITLKLPYSASMSEILLIGVKGVKYAILRSGVHGVLMLRPTDITEADGRRTLAYNGEELPIIGLGDILESAGVAVSEAEGGAVTEAEPGAEAGTGFGARAEPETFANADAGEDSEAGGDEKRECNDCIVVKSTDGLIALVADEVFGQMEVIQKPLGKLFPRTELYCGSAYTGGGFLAFILDPSAIAAAFAHREPYPAQPVPDIAPHVSETAGHVYIS